MNNKKQYQTMVLLNEERKKKFEYICQEESRNKTNMISFLIDYYYQRLQKKKLKENEVIIKNPTPKDFDPYEEALKLRGSKIWEGDLDEMRKGRVLDYDSDNG